MKGVTALRMESSSSTMFDAGLYSSIYLIHDGCFSALGVSSAGAVCEWKMSD